MLRITVRAEHPETENAIEKAWKTIEDFEHSYSRFRSDNCLSQINARLGIYQPLPEELWEILSRVEHFENTFPGSGFTLHSLAPLVRHGYGPEEHIAAPQRGHWERRNGEFLTSAPIELGGIGKGWILEKIAKQLALYPDFCLDFWWDIYAQWCSEWGHPWRIAIESPFSSDSAIGYIHLDRQYLAVSGISRRRWGEYHHLIDPETLAPSQHAIMSAVLSPSGAWADMLATMLCVTSSATLKGLSHLQKERWLRITSPTDYQVWGMDIV